jgi:hypothetical protein
MISMVFDEHFCGTHPAPSFLRINKAEDKHFQVFETRWANLRKCPEQIRKGVKKPAKESGKGNFSV